MLIKILMCLVLPFVVSYMVYYFDFRVIKKIKPKKSAFKPIKWKEKNIFHRLFIQFPKQLALDTLNSNPDEFPEKETGLHIIEGEQGAGKTTVMTYLLNQKQKQYQAVEVFSNYGYIHENKPFTDWKEQFLYQCGETGAIYSIDEIHIWLCSSLESKDFSPELLKDICQNRKNHRAIYGTVQIFNRCPKPIREQTKLIYTPVTLFGCLTFCMVRKPILDEFGSVKSYKFRKLFFFVHSEELRKMFNTHDVISKMKDSGFIRRESETDTIIDVSIEKEKKNKKKTGRIIGFEKK